MEKKQTTTDTLQKREKFAIGLRKKKTQDLVKAKRKKFLDSISKGSRKETYRGYGPWCDANYEPMNAILCSLAPKETWEKFDLAGEELNLISTSLEIVQSGKCQEVEQLAIMTKLRLMFKDQNSTPEDMKRIIEGSGLLTMLSDALSIPDENGTVDPQTNTRWSRYLQLEAMWILSHLSNGPKECLERLFDPNLKLLDFCNKVFEAMNDEFMLEQVIWVVANTAGDCYELQTLMLKNTVAVKSIQKYLQDKIGNENLMYSELLKQMIWLLTNFVRKPVDEVEPPQIDDTELAYQRTILDLMLTVLGQFDTLMPQSQNDLFYGLCSLCASGHEYMLEQLSKCNDFYRIVIERMTSMAHEEAEHALNAAGELTSCEQPEPADCFIFYNGLLALKEALDKHHDRELLKIALWNLSNIAAGTPAQVNSMFNVDGLWTKCLEMMRNEDQIVKREALMILTNFLTACEDDNLKAQVVFNSGENQEVISIIIDALTGYNAMDKDASMELLEALQACFQLDLELELPEQQRFQYLFEIRGGFEPLESMQHAPVTQVREMAMEIIKEFLPFDEADGTNAQQESDSLAANHHSVRNEQNANQLLFQI